MSSSIEPKAEEGAVAPLGSSSKKEDDERGEIVEITAGFTPEEEKRVLRKIDCTILPMVRTWLSLVIV
jgi:hypothetical protein